MLDPVHFSIEKMSLFFPFKYRLRFLQLAIKLNIVLSSTFNLSCDHLKTRMLFLFYLFGKQSLGPNSLDICIFPCLYKPGLMTHILLIIKSGRIIS